MSLREKKRVEGIAVGARAKEYPVEIDLQGHELTLRLMSPDDGRAVLKFTKGLPQEDLVFMRWDVLSTDGIKQWTDGIKAGRTLTVLAIEDDAIVGYGSLHYNQLYWTRHHGELRIMVNPALRGAGLGRALAKELFRHAADLGLRRLVVNIAADQPRVRHMFEDLGLHAVALLPEWVMDRNDRVSDLIIMSTELDA